MRAINCHLILLAGCIAMCSCREKPRATSESLKAVPTAVSESIPLSTEYWRSIPRPIGFVNDFDSLFTLSQRTTLDSICTLWKTQTEGEICIVTLPLSAMPADSFEAFVNRLSNTWGVGNKEADNGLVIGISKGHHKMRIATGKGLEQQLTDVQADGIIRQSFIPSYQKGDYYGGTLNGLNAIVALLRKMKH